MDIKKHIHYSRWTQRAACVLIVVLAQAGCAFQNQISLQGEVDALSTKVVDLQATLGLLSTVQSYQSTRVGLAQTWQAESAPVVTTSAPRSPVITSTPSPTAHTIVYGSVEIEDGICCAGGQAGDTIQLSVAFGSASSAGEVVEMRYVTASTRADNERMQEEEWVPYEAELSFSTRLAINWVGWWISVQYRDDQGNVSPIYYDDISLEGH
ncbi:MAG: hypothetical protein PVF49_10490 [Anaerolineales bacterium]|jgi:hypothetical protein